MIHLVTPTSHKQLHDVLWSSLSRAEYATGGEIDVAAVPMPGSIWVEGAGNLALPLSDHDFFKLKGVSQEAPYGRGTETLLDTGVRRAWQVDAAKVSSPQMPDFFSEVLYDLAVPALKAMGTSAHALGLQVRLYKLLLYEKGGHFKFHRDTEKEPGMFATMILQLPTESGHTGGELEIRHAKKSVTFDFSGDRSSQRYFNTVFFCDCEHRLAEVKSGSRLCLVFNLVRSKSTKFMDVSATALPHYVTALGNVERLLRLWADDDPSSPALAVPLFHKYSRNSLSFTGLKGHDRVVAGLVSNCADFLDVHLCMLVDSFIHDKYGDHRYTLEQWMQLNDAKAEYLEPTRFQVKNVNGQFSGHEPDEVNHHEYTGNEGGYNESVYYVGVLVVWRKDRMIEVFRARENVPSVLRWLEEQHKLKPESTSNTFQEYVTELSKQSGHANGMGKELLEFCLQHDLCDEAFMVMKEWGSNLIEYDHSVIISAISKYGWADCYTEVLEDVLKEKCSTCAKVLKFPGHLLKCGMQDSAVCVARQLLKRSDIQSADEYGRSCLLECLLELELEDEALHLMSTLTVITCGYVSFSPQLVKLAKMWGERVLPRIEEFWQRSKDTILSKINKCRTDSEGFLKEFAKFVCGLEEEGCHDAALYFAKSLRYIDVGEMYGNNPVDGGDDFDKIYGGRDINDVDAIVLLLCREERLHEIVRSRLGHKNFGKLLVKMKETAKLIGLMKDDKVTQLFVELLSEVVKNQRIKSDLSVVVFWLGEENMVRALVKEAEYDPSIADGLADPSKMDRLLEEVKGWGEVGRNGLREVVEARLYYYDPTACEVHVTKPHFKLQEKKVESIELEKGLRKLLEAVSPVETETKIY